MRWLLPLGLFVIAAIAGFWLALNAIPGVIMGKAMDRIGALGGEAGDVRHAPRLREDNQTIVRASPDILYSVCVYDVSDRPVIVEAPWPADGNYTSVSFYDARTNNFAVFSDRDAGTAISSRILLQSDGSGAATPVTIRSYDADQDRLVLAPTSRGLILYRRVIDADTDMTAAETERRGFTCARLSDE